jgi:hypothetical protein
MGLIEGYLNLEIFNKVAKQTKKKSNFKVKKSEKKKFTL